MIESVNNDKVKELIKLKTKKYQKETGLFLVEGVHLVEEAEKCGQLKEVYVLDGKENNFPNATIVSFKVMKKITELDNPPSHIGVVAKLNEGKINGNVLILDNINDPGNLGTIIRSAVAFNLGTLIISKDTVDLYNSKVIRASEGLIFHLNFIIADSIEDVLLELKKQNYTIYATKVEGGLDLRQVKFNNDKSAIIMGNEGAGVKEKYQKEADELLYIPMNASCESLNVAVASSVILYELMK